MIARNTKLMLTLQNFCKFLSELVARFSITYYKLCILQFMGMKPPQKESPLYGGYINCDCLSENLPSSHLPVFREIPF